MIYGIYCFDLAVEVKNDPHFIGRDEPISPQRVADWMIVHVFDCSEIELFLNIDTKICILYILYYMYLYSYTYISFSVDRKGISSP
jgi:hypothetical protein